MRCFSVAEPTLSAVAAPASADRSSSVAAPAASPHAASAAMGFPVAEPALSCSTMDNAAAAAGDPALVSGSCRPGPPIVSCDAFRLVPSVQPHTFKGRKGQAIELTSASCDHAGVQSLPFQGVLLGHTTDHTPPERVTVPTTLLLVHAVGSVTGAFARTMSGPYRDKYVSGQIPTVPSGDGAYWNSYLRLLKLDLGFNFRFLPGGADPLPHRDLPGVDPNLLYLYKPGDPLPWDCSICEADQVCAALVRAAIQPITPMRRNRTCALPARCFAITCTRVSTCAATAACGDYDIVIIDHRKVYAPAKRRRASL